MSRKILLIVNPAAGKGASVRHMHNVEEFLQAKKIAYELKITKEQYDAQNNIAAWIKNGITEIMCLGGDGTLNEIINGLYPAVLPIRIIGSGTGNDLVKAIGVTSMDIFFDTDDFKNVNVFSVNGLLGLNAIGIGFDGEVVRSMNHNNLPIRGILAYMIFVIKHLLGFVPPMYNIIGDKVESEGRYYIALVANGKAIGGGFHLTPNADPCDDYLDLCLIKDLPMIMRPLFVLKVLMKKHIYDRNVIIKRIKRIKIKSSRLVYAQLDGQLIRDRIFDVEIKSYKCRIIAGSL